MRTSRKRLLLLLLSFSVVWACSAQVIIEPQLPAQGLIQQQQLWNILVVNNGDAITNAGIQLSFQEEGSGRKIFSAMAGPFSLPKGPTQLSVKDMGAVQYNYLSAAYGSLSAAAGLLPAGRFIACYNLLQNPAKNGQVLSQNCLPLAVEPLGPPQLAYPADKSGLSASYPVFNWIAPAPAGMFNNLNYKLVVAEIKSGQSPADAIRRNPILFIQTGIKEIVIPYPSSYTPLQEGKWYAWQIIAQNDNTYSAATEVWSFSIKADSLAVLLDNAAYPHLQRGPGTTHFAVQQKMKFSYDNEADDSLLIAKVYSYDRQGYSTVFSRELLLKRGINFIEFDLDRSNGLRKGQEYVLEIINGRKENWNLRFKYEPVNP